MAGQTPVTNTAIGAQSAWPLLPGGIGYPTESFTLVETGQFTANGATAVVVANAAVTANSLIVFTLATVGGTPAGAPYCSAITVGTGFSVKAAGGDTSVYNYMIIG